MRRLTVLLFVLLWGGVGCDSDSREVRSWGFDSDTLPVRELDTSGSRARETGTEDSTDSTPTRDVANRDTTRSCQTTELVLENRRDSAVWIQIHGAPCTTDPSWLEIRGDGNRTDLFALRPDCPSCTCDEVTSTETACPCTYDRCPAPRAIELESGEKRTVEWSGCFWERDEVEVMDGERSLSCLRRHVPSAGTSMAAEMCWGTDVRYDSEDGREVPREIRDEACREVRFRYGEDTEVEHTIE